ncbi:choice-of-anchor Q domain-containing protein [uncultured Spirosoma sp.]|uniref:choice-of-anchor Q domain-containing protein n=1 Tax=uncultured Spirosoma sp. TaxID=278208 RepID=UPI002587563E|nr:choice-of-anchor Q domain-containing protein [uncultured Spirosoma sp.]
MRQLFTALFVCLFLSSAIAQSTVYVTPTGSGNQSGGSWSDAIAGPQLQARLASATAGTQFWIKGGSYSPGILRTATFQIPSGVQVYGGFVGNESQLTQRQISSPSSTTFTGETGDPNITGDNNAIVVTFNQVSADTRLDGVVITRSTDKGIQNRLSGSQDKSSSPTIANCRVENNEGGGLNNEAIYGPKCIMTLINCQFINNQSSFGGAISNRSGSVAQASLTVINCRFENNKATSSDGGAIYNDSYEFGSSAISLQNCQFIGNQSAANGGAIRTSSLSGGGSITMTACLFRKNVASGNGGAVYANADRYSTASIQLTNCLLLANRATNGGATYNYGNMGTSDVTMTNSTLVDNVATTAGGTLFCQSEGSVSGSNRTTNVIPTVKNSIVRNNTAQNQPFLYYAGSTSTANVTYSDIQGGFSGTGNIDADPLFVDSRANDYRLRSGSPAINAGDPAGTTATVSATDIGGHTRIVDNRIDMGASEWPTITVRFVTTSGSGDQSGTSWSNALPGTQLQSRLASASAGTQFWLAGGTYKPTASADRTVSFSVASGVQLYGGFTGSENNVSERAVTQPSSTTLSGDIGAIGNMGDNSYHVVSLVNASNTTLLDNIVVTAGNANSNVVNTNVGGGIYSVAVEGGSSAPTIRYCLIVANNAINGGGLYNIATDRSVSTPVIQQSIFEANIASGSGGGSNGDNTTSVCRVMFTNCTFRRNRAISGGGISQHCGYNGNLGGDDLVITNCQFIDNKVTISETGTAGGGAVSVSSFSGIIRATVTNCLFTKNTSQDKGGAIYVSGIYYGTADLSLTNSTLVDNQATNKGGGIHLSLVYSGNATATAKNCILRNSTLGSGSDINTFNPTYNITYSNIEGGFSGTGNIDADPLFVDAANDDFRLKAGSPSINTGDPASTTATVSATDLDGNQRVAENRIDMGTYEFQVSAVTGSDLSLRLNVDSRTPGANQAVTYQLTVTNDGPLKATGVTWQNRLPDNMTFVGGSNLSLNNGVLSGYVASLEPGASNTFTYQLQPTQAGQYINAAQITTADQPDPDSQPNSGTGDGQDDAAQVDIRVGGASSPVYASANPNQVPLPPVQSNQPTPDPAKVDLALSLSVDNRVPKVGDVLTYVLTVTNQGGATASNVRVTAYLPDGQQFDSSADGMSVSDGGVSGGTASIPASGQTSVRFTARVTSAKMGVTKAQIRQASPADVDSTPDNGTDNGEDDTAQVDLRSQPGL